MARVWAQKSIARARIPWFVAQMLPISATIAMVFLPLEKWLGDAILVIMIFPACLWIAAGTHIPSWAAILLSGLGAISYPLYAIHAPILKLAARSSTAPLMIVSVALGCLLFAAAVAALLERGAWLGKRRALAGIFVRVMKVWGRSILKHPLQPR